MMVMTVMQADSCTHAVLQCVSNELHLGLVQHYFGRLITGQSAGNHLFLIQQLLPIMAGVTADFIPPDEIR